MGKYMTKDTNHKIGDAAILTHKFLLHQGGWWDLSEISLAFGFAETHGLKKQIQALYHHKCIARKGAGVAGDRYRYGVTAACAVPRKGM